ncbi:MAG: putative 2OG-Fe(II) oxygenase [Gammaproteobacteria bacterium]|nr:putative 2OG-Fe(II) oxygenase [Gammaproteobacteria bacterium]
MSRNLADWLQQAMTLHQQGRLDQADELYAQVLDTEQGNRQALRLRGILARQRADFDLSIRLLQRLGRLAPQDPVSANELALTFLATGELYAAELALRDVVQADHASGQVLANLGAILQRRGHLDEAATQYAACLELDPDDLEVRCNYANALMEAGHGDRALSEIDPALLTVPGHPLMLANKGAVLCGLDEFAAAIEVLEKTIDIAPCDDMALINLAYARRRCGDAAGAADALQVAVRVNPANARAVADLANTEMQLGHSASALQRCTDFLAKYPGERLVLTAYIYALADTGQCDKSAAIQGLDELVTIIDSTPPDGYVDSKGFNRCLADYLVAHPSLITNPVRKSTAGGMQTGELNPAEDCVIEAFTELINAAVHDTVNSWRQRGFNHHPVMAYAADHWTLRIWGTVLGSGGHQSPHTHPLGWLSGVYYAQLPEDMQADDPQAGALEFGMPADHFYFSVDPKLRCVVPAEGRLVLFPSYCYHRTLDFVAKSKRISIAFDVVPLSR